MWAWKLETVWMDQTAGQMPIKRGLSRCRVGLERRSQVWHPEQQWRRMLALLHVRGWGRMDGPGGLMCEFQKGRRVRGSRNGGRDPRRARRCQAVCCWKPRVPSRVFQ